MNTSVFLSNEICQSGKHVLLSSAEAGATFCLYSLPKGKCAISDCNGENVRIFILLEGSLKIGELMLGERGILTVIKTENIQIAALSDSRLLEISLKKTADACSISSPNPLLYRSAPKYREDCKSEKTVSRMLLQSGVISGIAIGSVETYGKDTVAAHCHPDCDQFFFSFAENDMSVIIDTDTVPMKGERLLHIPLGSTHGVEVCDGGCAHYLWIDFILNEQGAEYMDSAHEFI